MIVDKIKLVVIVFQLVMEFIKWLEKSEQSKLEGANKFKAALKAADKGDTHELENLFTINRDTNSK